MFSPQNLYPAFSLSRFLFCILNPSFGCCSLLFYFVSVAFVLRFIHFSLVPSSLTNSICKFSFSACLGVSVMRCVSLFENRVWMFLFLAQDYRSSTRHLHWKLSIRGYFLVLCEHSDPIKMASSLQKWAVVQVEIPFWRELVSFVFVKRTVSCLLLQVLHIGWKSLVSQSPIPNFFRFAQGVKKNRTVILAVTDVIYRNCFFLRSFLKPFSFIIGAWLCIEASIIRNEILVLTKSNCAGLIMRWFSWCEVIKWSISILY